MIWNGSKALSILEEDDNNKKLQFDKEDMMDKINIRKLIIILLHVFVGWVLCAAIVVIGREVTSLENTLIFIVVHPFHQHPWSVLTYSLR